MRLWKKCLILLLCIHTFIFVYLQWRLDGDTGTGDQLSTPINGSYRSSNSRNDKPLRKIRVRTKLRRSNQWQVVSKTLSKKHKSHLLDNLNFIEIFRHLYIFSAFHDNRLSTAYVRMVVLYKKKSQLPFWCHFPRYNIKRKSFSQDERSFSTPDINLTASSRGVFYETCEGHNLKLSAYVVSCPVPDYMNTGWPGYTIFLSKSNASFEDAVKITVMLPPHFPMTKQHLSNYKTGRAQEYYKEAPKWMFTVCVPPLYGNIQEKDLITFIELSRLLGATHIMFYLFTRNVRIRSVLKTYELENFVTYLSWELPITSSEIWYYGQSAAVWDCLMRNMHTSHWILFNDLDEFIIPHAPGVHTWGDLVSMLQSSLISSNSSIAAYSFKSAFYDPLSGQRHKPDMGDLVNMRATSVRSEMVCKFRNKLMVNPLKVFEVGIHHLSKPLRRGDWALSVNTSLAYIHHYRKCKTSYCPKCNKFATPKTKWRRIEKSITRTNRSLARSGIARS